MVEKKHSKNALFPSTGDIKDGIVKMMLFTNLTEASIDNKNFSHFAVLGLTSAKFEGGCHSLMTEEEIKNCLTKNNFPERQQRIVLAIFDEGKLNNFLVFLAGSDKPNLQNEMLDSVYE